jgi:hypothetical protein
VYVSSKLLMLHVVIETTFSGKNKLANLSYDSFDGCIFSYKQDNIAFGKHIRLY